MTYKTASYAEKLSQGSKKSESLRLGSNCSEIYMASVFKISQNGSKQKRDHLRCHTVCDAFTKHSGYEGAGFWSVALIYMNSQVFSAAFGCAL